MTTKKPTKKKTNPKPVAKKATTRKKAAPKQKLTPNKNESSSVDVAHQHEAKHFASSDAVSAAFETVKINIITDAKKKKSLWRKIFGFGF